VVFFSRLHISNELSKKKNFLILCKKIFNYILQYRSNIQMNRTTIMHDLNFKKNWANIGSKLCEKVRIQGQKKNKKKTSQCVGFLLATDITLHKDCYHTRHWRNYHDFHFFQVSTAIDSLSKFKANPCQKAPIKKPNVPVELEMKTFYFKSWKTKNISPPINEHRFLQQWTMLIWPWFKVITHFFNMWKHFMHDWLCLGG
jgi:hypothetical protein